MLENILNYSENLLKSVNFSFKRKYYKKIKNLLNNDEKIIWIFWKRWVWKTYLSLQLLKEKGGVYLLAHSNEVIKNSIFNIVKSLKDNFWYNFFVIDEIHKYPNWQLELKNIYDLIPDINLIISGSSKVSIEKSKVDLSRRIYFEYFDVLDFAEFLEFNSLKSKRIEIEKVFDPVYVNNLIKSFDFDILKYWDIYKNYGAYPFWKKLSNKVIFQKIQSIIDISIYEDLPVVLDIDNELLKKLKKFLIIISDSPVFELNAKNIIEELAIDKNDYYAILEALERIWLINIIKNFSSKSFNHNRVFKKILFSDWNLRASFSSLFEERIVWWIREDFFVNFIINNYLELFWSPNSDFKVKINNIFYTFEIWGKNKKIKTKYLEENNLYLVLDNIKFMENKKIPLFIFWMLKNS